MRLKPYYKAIATDMPEVERKFCCKIIIEKKTGNNMEPNIELVPVYAGPVKAVYYINKNIYAVVTEKSVFEVTVEKF